MDAALERELREASEEFLHYLQALMLVYNSSAARLPARLAEARRWESLCDGFRRAASLKLVAGTPDRPVLTALGKQVCDGVKQYCNWLGHADDLPTGVTEELVRGRRILDVGCGVGCALLTFIRHGAALVAGLDMMPVFPAMARIFAARRKLPPPVVALGDGAALPFADAAFDTIFCRLALNYMRSHKALAEMARVTRPGGHVVICLNTLRWHLQTFGQALRRGQGRAVLFDLFRFINGTIFQLTGRQITLRFPGRMHAVHSPVWHTPGSMIRHLRRWGMETVWHNADTQPATPTFRARRNPCNRGGLNGKMETIGTGPTRIVEAG